MYRNLSTRAGGERAVSGAHVAACARGGVCPHCDVICRNRQADGARAAEWVEHASARAPPPRHPRADHGHAAEPPREGVYIM